MNEPTPLVSRDQITSLLRLARLLTADPRAAEDLVQECLVRAAANRERVEASDHRPAYLRKMLLNVHVDHHRATLRQLPTTALDDIDVPADDDVDFAVRQALWQAIVRLPPRQRACVVLRYYEDLDPSEIADHLDIKPSAVRSNLARALRTLRVTTSGTSDEGTGPWTVKK